MTNILKIFNKENIKNIVIVFLLVASFVLFFSKKENHVSISAVGQVGQNNLPVDIAKSHRLNSCDEAYGETIKDRENYLASSSVEVDGYKVLLNCSYAVNSYYPDQKGEYFVIENVKNKIKYYIVDNKERVLGGPNIIGVKDNFLFYNYCWEGCSAPEYFQLGASSDDKETEVYPEKIDVLYRQGLSADSKMIIYNNRILFVSPQKIQELNIDTFSLGDIKTITKDEIFGIFGEFAGEFIPDFKLQDDGILFNIYAKEKVINTQNTVLPINTFFLKFK